MSDANAEDVREANIRAEFELLESQINDPDMRARITASLPSTVPFPAFRNAVLAAIRSNKDLLFPIYRESLIAALGKAAAQGLVPDGRQGALVLQYNKRVGAKEVVWRSMVAGQKSLAFKALGALIDTHIVYEGEHFVFEAGDDEKITHVIDPACVAKGLEKAIGGYAIARLADGRVKRKWLPASYVRSVQATAQSQVVWGGPFAASMWHKTFARAVINDLDTSLPTEDAARLRNAMDDDPADFDGVIAQGVPQIAAPAPSVNPLDLLDAKLAERDGYHPSELPGHLKEAVKEAKMAPEHAGLNSLMDEQPQPKRRGRPPKAQKADADVATAAQMQADITWLDDRMTEIQAISNRSTYTTAVRAMILSPEYVAIKERMPEAVGTWTDSAEAHFESLPVPIADQDPADAVWVNELLYDMEAAKSLSEFDEIVSQSSDEVAALSAENPTEGARCLAAIATMRNSRIGSPDAAARTKAEKFVGWVRNKIAENHDLDGNPDAKFIAHLFAQEKAKTAVAIISADPALLDLAADLVKLRNAA